MIDCVDSTALRAHLDHPDPALDAHLDGCAACTGLLHSVADDAGFARRTLAVLDPEAGTDHPAVDVDAALRAATARIHAAATQAAPFAVEASRRTTAVRRRLPLAGAAALSVLAVALTPAGGALADALDVFRGERLRVVAVDATTWAAFGPDDAHALAAIGEVDLTGLAEPERVASVPEAEALAGLAAPNLPGPPDRVLAMAPGTARLVLGGRPGTDVPAHLDGAALVVEVPGAIGAIYGHAGRPPEMVIGRSGPLVVRAEGASLAAVRSFLLEREELPAGLRRQLAAIDDWRSTIPVPVAVTGPGWEEVEVAGRPAIAFGDDSGLGAVVLRQDPDGVTVVGGHIPVGRALQLAAQA